MILKTSQFSIQDKSLRDIDNIKDYPNSEQLQVEKNLSNHNTNMVHRRRDLDSIG